MLRVLPPGSGRFQDMAPSPQGHKTSSEATGQMVSIFFFFLTVIYFLDRERQSMNGGGSEREGDTESEASSRLRAVSTEPDTGLELKDCEIMT